MFDQTENIYAEKARHWSESCNHAQQSIPSGLDKMGITIGILANHHMGRQRTIWIKTHVIMSSEKMSFDPNRGGGVGGGLYIYIF